MSNVKSYLVYSNNKLKSKKNDVEASVKCSPVHSKCCYLHPKVKEREAGLYIEVFCYFS